MAAPRIGDPFRVDGRSDALEVDMLEWGASRRVEPVVRQEYYVARTRAGDRYVLLPLDDPMADVRWRGIALRSQ